MSSISNKSFNTKKKKYTASLVSSSTHSAIDSYVSRLPKPDKYLTPQELSDLHIKYKNGDKKAGNAIIVSHLKFAIKIAYEYSGYNLNMEDLIQQANLGLVDALERFDSTKNVKFTSYAVFWIRHHIHDFLMDNVKLVKITTTQSKRKLFFSIRREMGKVPEDVEDKFEYLSKTLNLKREDIEDVWQRLNNNDVYSLGINYNQDEGSGSEYFKSMSAESNSQLDTFKVYEDDIFKDIDKDDIKKIVHEMIDTLPDRYKDVIRMRYLINDGDGVTQREIALKYNVTRQCIEQVEKKALNTLRKKVPTDVAESFR